MRHNRAIGQHTAAHRANNAVEHANKAGTGTHDNRYCATHGSMVNSCTSVTIPATNMALCSRVTCSLQTPPPAMAAGAGDDQQRSQVAHEHGADMLQTQRDRLFQGHFCVELIRRLFELDSFKCSTLLKS